MGGGHVASLPHFDRWVEVLVRSIRCDRLPKRCDKFRTLPVLAVVSMETPLMVRLISSLSGAPDQPIKLDSRQAGGFPTGGPGRAVLWTKRGPCLAPEPGLL
jgi:hypothetical protein